MTSPDMANRRVAGRAILARGTALVALLALAGCGGGIGGPESPASEQAPLALTPKAADNAEGGGSAVSAVQLNETDLRKAVERYRIIKRRSESPYDFAGVDLNGDGRPEAVVLFAGQDWCLKTGCSLVVFQEEQFGYRPVTHVTSARPPIRLGSGTSFGWRDLILQTGGGAAPVRDVRLAFTGRGYPGNALLQPEPTQETLSQAQQVLAESPAFTAAIAATK